MMEWMKVCLCHDTDIADKVITVGGNQTFYANNFGRVCPVK